MRTGLVLGLLGGLVIAGGACAPEASDDRAGARGDVRGATSAVGVTDGYIVVFRGGVANAPGLARSLVTAHQGTLGFVYTHVLHGFSARLAAAAAAAIASNPHVAYVEPDQTAHAIAEQSIGDSGLWGLDRIDQRGVALDGAYGYNRTGIGVVAYIIDTGIHQTHAQLAGRMIGHQEFVGDGTNTDCNGHGTHVAGTVGGTDHGVAKNVSLYGIRVLDCSGSGTYSGVIAGMDHAVAQHQLRGAGALSVANMSLGGPKSTALNDAVARMTGAGIVLAVAAGNEAKPSGPQGNACDSSPSGAPSALTVGATDRTDTRASFSSWGSCVDLFAPGVGIKSAWYTSDTATNTISGTSMASPHVAGAAALYLEANPGATAAQAHDAIVAAATQNIVQGSRSDGHAHLLYSRFGASSGPYCGDGALNQPTEQCDGPNLGGASCSTVGAFDGGTLSCAASCLWDTADCTACGDGTCDAGETCSSCAADCGACPTCGDGTCDAGESCSSCAADCGACPTCGLAGASCASDSDCCGGFFCRGKRGAQTCRAR